jgi:hypothetical protein
VADHADDDVDDARFGLSRRRPFCSYACSEAPLECDQERVLSGGDVCQPVAPLMHWGVLSQVMSTVIRPKLK